jgi:hypothetical protein
MERPGFFACAAGLTVTGHLQDDTPAARAGSLAAGGSADVFLVLAYNSRCEAGGAVLAETL